MSRQRDGDPVPIDELLADLPYIEARPPEPPERPRDARGEE
jgi:hypothetical protein